MADRLNGCHNRPRPVAGAPVLVQDGWYTHQAIIGPTGPQRLPLYTTAPFRMSTDCQYNASASDQGCAGCQHAPHLRQGAAP